MTVLWIILGIVIGAGGYWLYDKFFNKTEAVVKADVATVKTDVQKLEKKF